MNKTLQQQLQEAIDSGNVEMAKIIVEAMKVVHKPKKKTAKKSKSVKKKKSSLIIPTEAEVNEIINETQTEVVDLTNTVDEDDEDDNAETSIKPASKRGKDKTLCRQEPFKIGRRKNKFSDDGTLEPQDRVENNPTLAKMYAPANKMRASREKRKVVKAKVKCECGKIDVIPIALAPNVNNGERYRCNDCLTQGIERDDD